MKRYYEKANEEILNKCKSFIQENKGLSDYTVYKSANKFNNRINKFFIRIP